MKKDSARAELERGTRWTAVRSGLMVLAVTWTLSTLTSVAVQFFAAGLAEVAASGNDYAAVRLGALSNINLFVYSLFVIAFLFASLRLTRAAPDSGAVTPALIASVGFLALLIVNTAIALTRAPDPNRTLSGEAQSELWTVLALARAVAVAALAIALIRLAAARGRAIHRFHAGALLLAVLIDTGYPLEHILLRTQGTTPALTRGLLVLTQIALAALVIHLSLRTWRAIPKHEETVLKKPKKKRKKRGEGETKVLEEEPEPIETAPLPAPTKTTLTLVSLLMAGVVAVLPIWDAFSQPDLRVRSVAFCIAAVVFGFSLWRTSQSAPYGARAVFALMALISIAYAAVTASEIAVLRSHEIDSWPVCETGLDVRGNIVPHWQVRETGYDGPRLESGIPCTRAAERRDEHAELEPGGNVQDGLVQIGIRFRTDRFRIFAGTFAIVVAMIVSGVLVARAARAIE